MTELSRVEPIEVRALLAREWRLSHCWVRVHDGGMNSATWWVGDISTSLHIPQWVLKAVPEREHASLRGGLAVARHLDEAGIPSGAPIPTRSGDLTVTDGVRGGGDRAFALLTYLDGTELSAGDPGDVRAVGATLGRIHTALADLHVTDEQQFHWVDADAGHLGLRDWIGPAVRAALDAFDALDPTTLTHGMLHTDPAPEAFLRGEDGAVGLIDWSVAMRGPLLYDLASAVMYAGGLPADTDREADASSTLGPAYSEGLISSYLETGPLDRREIDRGLATMIRFRWAVQADYFARRITVGDLTGIDDAAGNEKGLEDARRQLLRQQ